MPEFALVSNDYVPETPAQTTPEVVAPQAEAQVTPEVTPEAQATPEITQAIPEATPQVTPQPAEEIDYYEKLGLPKGGGDFTKIIDAYKAGPDVLKDYIKIATTDYSKFEPLELVRMDFDKQYSALSPKDRDDLWQHKLETEYHITGDAEADKFAMLEIQAKANVIRSGLIADQQNFKIPTYQPESKETEIEQQRLQEAERAKELIVNNPDFKSLEASKTLKLGTGDDTFTMEVPFDVRNAVLNENILSHFWKTDDKGNPQFDAQTFAMAKALATDPVGFCTKLINHGKSLKEHQTFQELNNPAPQAQDQVPSGGPKYVLVN